KGAEEPGDELGQDLARALAARRPVPTVMPTADRRRHRVRLRVAHLAQGGERAGIVLDPGEDEVAGPGEARRLLEEFGVVPLDPLQMVAEIGAERRDVLVAEEDGDACEPGGVGGDAM